MDNETTDLVRQARTAVKSGDKAKARALLEGYLPQHPDDHKAWLIMVVAAPTPQEALEYAQHAAQLAPDDPATAKGLAWAKRKANAAPKPIAPAAPMPQREEEKESRKRPSLLYGAMGFFALLLLLAGATFVWTLFGSDGNADDTALAALPSPLPQATIDDNNPIAAPSPSTPTTTPHPIQPKPIAADAKTDPRATWTLTPTPTNTPTPSPTWQPTFLAPQEGELTELPLEVGPRDKWVDVNLTTQTLTAYEGKLPVFQTLISSGLPQHETVTGQFRIWLRFESQTMDGSRLGYDYYLENVPYVMYFFEDYALHGTFWHSNFGHPMSHGCVNLETNDAGWIFNWSEMGTVVNVHY